ncbi:hypothetical protein [Paenibacillus sp. NEAU-GSW1]|uniref:hypothetical protein n=1 Tax=Paenibacillus sp. NEAU-GSW1 TaxID=2682486 RepID=UPI0012E2A232|nr:hypothetical protein [Paenibacillus sp. NEAU-GSW1]MUT65515.1 hypothetical protein [Paenibacillus sp. NEAU-GSW1]
MEKRLTRTAMFFSVGFVFMVACAAAAFFFGLKLGTEKAEAAYEKEQLESEAAQVSTPYQQQDLVSFYHTVFLPYREFQSEWQKAINKLAQGQQSEAVSMLDGLSDLASRKRNDAASFDMQKSPLLGQAQANIINSLKQFEKASDKAVSLSKSAEGQQLIAAIGKEESYKSAVSNALAAQQSYYAAMMKWGASVDPEIPSDYTSTSIMEISQWKALPLIVKNKLMADQLNKRKQLMSFYPQDLTSRVDEFIKNGQQSSMKVRSVSAIVDLLINTKAVRYGDFIENKAALYDNEMLPQLPFYYQEIVN